MCPARFDILDELAEQLDDAKRLIDELRAEPPIDLRLSLLDLADAAIELARDVTDRLENERLVETH
jgi:hypothetical protein